MTESSASAAIRPATDAVSPEPLLVEIDAGVAWLRFNRPEAMNSLDKALKDALVAAISRVAEDRRRAARGRQGGPRHRAAHAP